MRILSIHNAYQIRGGEDVSTAAEQSLLRHYGHTVDVYEENNERIKDMGAVQVAQRTLWSQESYETVRIMLRTHPYDVVHVQNFFPLISPSVYYAAKSENVPVVQTLRNYRLICPNALFFRDGKVCEDCLGKPIPYPGIVHGCYREDRKASAAVASMVTSHRFLRTWHRMVDQYVTLTQFARNKMIEGGLPADKIVVKPNFVAPEPSQGEGKGNYALFVGRLSVEKGLDTLLDAWKHLENPIPLKIVGDGPLSDMVTAASEQQPCIEWLGRCPMDEVHQLMGDAQFLIFPSKWYETFGRVAVEAFAKGTPVIAANIGAIAEIVTPGYTGLHFTPGDPEDLARQVTYLLTHPQQQEKMRHNARQEFEAKYTSAANYAQLMAIYFRVLSAATFHQNAAELAAPLLT